MTTGTATTVLGFDIGFSSFGWATLELGATMALDRVGAMGVIRTQKANKKRDVKAVDDNIERAAFIHHGLLTIFERHAPRVVCAESMSFPRSSSVAAKMAMAWGVVIAELGNRGLPFRQASPQEVKLSVCGARDASKADIRSFLDMRFGWNLAEQHLAGIPEGQVEHPYDALASIMACLDTDVVRMARASVKRAA